ncbi:MAG: septal ring lytic transglycosylase RlpA family protein [Beijerinckiaceae bacterium]
MSFASFGRFAGLSALVLLVANCASEPTGKQRTLSAQNQREIGAFSDKRKYGNASPRVVADNQPVPKGGGRDHVGKPYQVAGRWYTPRENTGYSASGQSSWYGDAFHGRKTANGEIYDKNSYTAAHPTMPLPSYARVTNATNGRSIIVRVNDRGPFHGGRIIDVSERVAHALEFKHLGTARVRVDYVQRASTKGSDDRKLVASLRTDGQLAQLPGGSTPIPSQQPILVASAAPVPVSSTPVPAERPAIAVAAPATAFAPSLAASPSTPSIQPAAFNSDSALVAQSAPLRRSVPLPPERPFDLGTIPGAGTPIDRVNNGQITPAGVRATSPSIGSAPQPRPDRVAAVYYAPDEGFSAVFGGKDPMRLLKTGRFDATTLHKPVKAR